MTTHEQRLNLFLVQVFNDILRLEEVHLRNACRTLSVNEVHVLEAVERCVHQGNAGMADIAARLGITSGTLTVAAKTLAQKGYLTRVPGEQDKRRASLALTDAAQPILAAHTAFHEHMVASVSRHLSPPQLDTLSEALSSMHTFFAQL